MKRLNAWFLLLALYTVSAWAETKTVTRTIWREDFTTWQSNDLLFDNWGTTSGTKNNDSKGQAQVIFVPSGIPNTQDVEAYYESGHITKAVMCQGSGVDVYTYFDIGDIDPNNEITDNWCFTFEVTNQQRINFFTEELSVTAAATESVTMPSMSANKTFLTITKVDGSESNRAYYKVRLAGQELDGTFDCGIASWNKITLTCKNANSTTATLEVKQEAYNTLGLVEQYRNEVTFNPSEYGKIRGIHTGFNNVSASYFANFNMSIDEDVDATPCAAPTLTAVRPELKARVVRLNCETEGAKIYYSNSPLGVDDEGWTEYTDEFSTSDATLYAYAYNPANETKSEVVSLATGAGEAVTVRADFEKVSYDETKGYACKFDLSDLYTEYNFEPENVTVRYKVGSGDYKEINAGEIFYVTEGESGKYRVSAEGYKNSTERSFYTSARPKVSTLWGQDFASLVDSNTYGTDEKTIKLASHSSAAFVSNNVTKNGYAIEGFAAGSGNVEVSVDSRLTLTTDSCYYLAGKDSEGNGGLLGTKYPVPGNDDETYNIMTDVDGLVISGLASGQYIYVATAGGTTSMSYGANYQEEMSVTTEQIYEATASTALIEIPRGTYVTGITVRSNSEVVQTNDYGILAYVSDNALSFEDNSEIKAEIITDETRSGVFVRKAVSEVPAGTPFILTGKPNTTYSLSLSNATVEPDNLLTYSRKNFAVNSQDRPVYVVNEKGELVLADANDVIPAKTPYIISNLDVAEYYDVTLNGTGKLAIIYGKPLSLASVEGLTAQYVSSETLAGGFGYTSISEIPAEVPVILTGTPNTTYSIQVGTATDKSFFNRLRGSLTEAFNTVAESNIVYKFSAVSGELEVVDKSVDAKIPAGTVYLVSRYRGFQNITLNASATASLTAIEPLDFTEIAVNPYIVTEETETGLTEVNVTNIPAGEAFILKGGEAGKTYTVPFGVATDFAGTTNLLTSKTADFPVADTEYYVYALDANTGKLQRMAEDYSVPAGEAYYISQYPRKPDLGTETITIVTSAATYVSEHALDFSGRDDIKAYIIVDETLTELKWKQVMEVPAGTAFIVKGASGDYEVAIGTCTSLPYKNLMRGSREHDYHVSETDSLVYVLSKETGKLERTTPNFVVPAGKGYVVSKYPGIERITTGAQGYATHISYNALDFRGIEGVTATIVVAETGESFNMRNVEQVNANCAFIFKGEPDSTYVIPVGTLKNLGYENKLRGSNIESFITSDAGGRTVYVVSKAGKLTRLSSSVTEFPAGKAYLISKYSGSESVTTNEYGYVTHIATEPLDLSEFASVTAYVVSSEDEECNFEKSVVKFIPAGTPFLLKGQANTTYSLPIQKAWTVALDAEFNMLAGSLNDTYTVDDDKAYVYTFTAQGDLEKQPDGTKIPIGVPYVETQNRGYETITTNANGYTSYVSSQPLDFTSFGDEVKVEIVTGETITDFNMYSLSQVPANTPLFFTGAGSTTYKVPVGTCKSLPEGVENKLQVKLTDTLYVSDYDTYVYAMSAKTGKLTKLAATLKLPPRKVFFVSRFRGTEKVTTNANGFVSYVSEHPLDFTEVEGLTATILTGETEDAFTLRDVKEIPANCAVLLKGEPSTTYEIPIGTRTEAMPENLLRGSLKDEFEVNSVAPNIVYVFSGKTGKLTKIAAGLTLAARKAYYVSLYTYTTSAKNGGYFEEEATNVDKVADVPAENEEVFYNLAGQPVDKSYKGIVIDKRGRKYNRK